MPRLPFRIVPVVNLTALLVWVGIVALTVAHQPWMRQAFIYTSYYFILTLTVVWVFSLIRLWREKKPNAFVFIKSHWRGIIFSLVLTSFIFVSVPKHFRLLSDETNLLSVAKSMTFYKHVYNIVEGKWYYDMFWPITPTFIEKRPLLFPFFTSITHIFWGYRVENVFILNFFILWTVLFLLYWLLRPWLGDVLTFAGLILVMAQPMMAWSATSGGFELFNFLFILISFICFRYFLRHPDSLSFLVLAVSLAMLGNIRYESIVFFLVVMTVLGINGYIRTEFLKQSAGFALVPFFFLPWIWQRIIFLTEKNTDFPAGSWLEEFRFATAWENVPLFFKYIFSFDGQLGYAGALNLVGIIATFCFMIVYLFRMGRSMDKHQTVLWDAWGTSILFLFAGALLYQASIKAHPMNGRYYMAVLVFLSVVPVFFIGSFLKDKTRAAIPVLLGAVAIFMFYHPVAVADQPASTLFTIREFRFLKKFLENNADQRALIVCGRPGQLIVYNRGAIYFETANKDAQELLDLYKKHLFSSIYVAQPIDYETGLPKRGFVLDVRYQLEAVAEAQMDTQYFLRISRVKLPVDISATKVVEPIQNL